jgi:AAHS family 3-hydroxyphenylpropionic acid transporter
MKGRENAKDGQLTGSERKASPLGAIATAIRDGVARPVLLSIAILLGLFEGADIGSMGLTLSRLSRVLHLDPSQAGICASASLVGLALGASAGGRWADVRGRRVVMITSIILLGGFSVATAYAWSFESLLVVRLLTGLGIGGLFPCLIAMAGDSATPAFRSTAIGMLMASGPGGGILAGLVAMLDDWRWVFMFGGIGPLVVLPILLRLRLDALESGITGPTRLSISYTLFGGRRATGTLLIWIISFCTAFIGYIMINWLPSLVLLLGMSERQSHFAAILYSSGGILGNLIAGRLVDRGLAPRAYVAGYTGAALCIVCLASIHISVASLPIVFAAGMSIIGVQLVTLSLAPIFYPTEVRTTGIGAVVASGRLGSVFGPLVAGQMLHVGLSAGRVLFWLVPTLGLALILALLFTVVFARRPIEPPQTASAMFTI